MGAECAAAEYLRTQLDDPPHVAITRNRHGSFDIYVKVDGGYTDATLAESMGNYHRAELWALIGKPE